VVRMMQIRMRTRLRQRLEANSALISNSSSLIGTRAVTAGLGFVYWWLAARLFVPEAVGLASALVSTMLLLGTFGMLGLGTFLIGELPRRRGEVGSLITISLLVAGVASAGLGAVFAIAAPSVSLEFAPLSQSPTSVLLFASGVALTGVVMVLDQALIGLLRGGLQLWRNTVFAAAKLGIMVIISLWIGSAQWAAIFASWVAGDAVSTAALAIVRAARRGRVIYRPRPNLLGRVGRLALEHHALNLSLQAPGLLLPLVVTALLSAAANAHYYVSWMMVSSAVYVIPMSLSTVIYAVGSTAPSDLDDKMRQTLTLSLVLGGLAAGALSGIGGIVLKAFGPAYAEEALWPLRIMGLAVFPQVVKYYYVAVSRLQNRIGRAAFILVLATVLEVAAAALSARLTGGLVGLTLGWLVAQTAEAVFMLPAVLRAVNGGLVPDTPDKKTFSEVA